MIVRNPLSYALIAAAAAFSSMSPLHAASEQQLNELSVAFEKAWKAKDVGAILALHELKGLPQGTVDFKVSYWETIIQVNEKAPNEWGGTKFLSREDGLTENPTRNVAAYRLMTDDRTVNGRSYVVNLPIVGFLTLKTAGESGIVTAVGVNSEGKLRFVDHAPTNPEGTEYRLAAPIPAQGIAQANPSEEAISRFKEAILSAVESRNFIALYHTEGASADLVDTDTDTSKTTGGPTG